MGCPGNPQLAFQLQHELWASPKKQGPSEGSVTSPAPVCEYSYSNEVGASEI